MTDLSFAKRAMRVDWAAPEEFSASPVENACRLLAADRTQGWLVLNRGEQQFWVEQVKVLRRKAYPPRRLREQVLQDHLNFQVTALHFAGDGTYNMQLVGDFLPVTPPSANRTDQSRTLEPPQYDLELVGDFTPSAKLLGIWRDNVETALSKTKEAHLPKRPDSEAAKEFSKALKLLLGSAGQERRYSSKAGRKYVSSGNRFDPNIQLDLCERFLIVPDQSATFLSVLHQELVSYLRTGATLSGGWGRLVLEDNVDIVFDLAEPNFRKPPANF